MMGSKPDHLILLAESPTAEQLYPAAATYEAIVWANMQLVVDRYNRRPAYPWIDTKFSVITGEDFAQEDLLRGPETVYGMIQGRALESLAGHARWLRRTGRSVPGLVASIDQIVRELLTQVTGVWEANGGHMYYWMTPDGEPFTLNERGERQRVTLTASSPYNCSDLFCCKGMYAAARYLQDAETMQKAKTYCLKMAQAVRERSYRSDQQTMDPKHPAETVPGCHEHGDHMIQIGTAKVLAEFEDDAAFVELGLGATRYILAYHVNLNNRFPTLRDNDFVEFTDDFGQPYETAGKIPSDPGHALEFVGLVLTFTSTCKQHSNLDTRQRAEIDEIESLMPALLRRNFANGFQPETGGICKLFDLVGRGPINSDMPWWSLPETLRAALKCYRIAPSRECLEIFSQCHNAFVEHYIRSDLSLMAYQTRDAGGAVVDVIPATPDADPGYHTGLSLLDCIDMIIQPSHGREY